jgi:hypothetical protein
LRRVGKSSCTSPSSLRTGGREKLQLFEILDLYHV